MANPEHIFNLAGDYHVQLIYSNGFCTDTTEQSVHVYPLADGHCSGVTPQLWVPTAFTPNGDGLNDNFRVTAQSITQFSITIYDRWGQQVFTSQDPNFAWDGTFRKKLLPSGIYLYQLKATGIDGRKINKTGSVLLIRGSK